MDRIGAGEAAQPKAEVEARTAAEAAEAEAEQPQAEKARMKEEEVCDAASGACAAAFSASSSASSASSLAGALRATPSCAWRLAAPPPRRAQRATGTWAGACSGMARRLAQRKGTHRDARR